jgi:hypothetical protein
MREIPTPMKLSPVLKGCDGSRPGSVALTGGMVRLGVDDFRSDLAAQEIEAHGR